MQSEMNEKKWSVGLHDLTHAENASLCCQDNWETLRFSYVYSEKRWTFENWKHTYGPWKVVNYISRETVIFRTEIAKPELKMRNEFKSFRF